MNPESKCGRVPVIGILFLFCVLAPTVTAQLQRIDFEGTGLPEGAQLTTQITGLQISNGILATVGDPLGAFVSIPEADTAFGAPFAGDFLSGVDSRSILQITFDNPVPILTFTLADIDAAETVTLEAFDDSGGLLETITFVAGGPGTGDAVAIPVALAATGIKTLRVTPTQPALYGIDNLNYEGSAEPFGTGCAGSAGIPLLAAAPGSLPLINKTFMVELTSLPTTSLHQTYVVVGLSTTNWGGITLPQNLGVIGFPACTQYVSIDASVSLPSNMGKSTWGLPIPNDPSLVRLAFYLQGAVIDLASGSPQLSVTNALQAVIR